MQTDRQTIKRHASADCKKNYGEHMHQYAHTLLSCTVKSPDTQAWFFIHTHTHTPVCGSQRHEEIKESQNVFPPEDHSCKVARLGNNNREINLIALKGRFDATEQKTCSSFPLARKVLLHHLWQVLSSSSLSLSLFDDAGGRLFRCSFWRKNTNNILSGVSCFGSTPHRPNWAGCGPL